MAIPIDDFIAAHQQAASIYEDYQAAVAHYDETGEWAGQKFKVGRQEGQRTLKDGKPLKDIAKETFAERESKKPGYLKSVRAEMDKTLATLKKDSMTAGFRLERKRMRIDQGTVDVEDFSQEEWDRLVARSKEIRTQGTEASKAFNALFDASPLSKTAATIPQTGDMLGFVLHSGAPELEGGILKGSKTVGSHEAGKVTSGDTASINRNIMGDLRVRIAVAEKGDTIKENKWEMEAHNRRKKFYSIAGQEGDFLTGTAPSGMGLSYSYLGRTDWSKFGQKSIEEAGSISESTGGRGTAYLVAGAQGITVGASGGGGESLITGDIKPIGGLSQAVWEPDYYDEYDKVMKWKETWGSTMPDGSVRSVHQIWEGWAEEQMIAYRAKVAAGEVAVTDLYGERGARILGLVDDSSAETAAVAARVSSRAVPETIEEGVQKVIQRSGSTGRLLGAATEASAAVAGGINSNPALKSIGAAMTVLRGRL